MKKIVIIGANGQLGTELSQNKLLTENYILTKLTHNDVALEDYENLQTILKNSNPDYVINTAAMHNVEDCEKDVEKSFAINGIGVKNLATISNDLKFKLIHYSTDYVFDGHKNDPYQENDQENPLNIYGITKLAGEKFIQAISENYSIIRVSGIYGKYPCRAKNGLNFVQLMLKLGNERDEVRVVDNEVLSPTNVMDIVDNTLVLLEKELNGVFHMSSEGSCSWYEFANEIFKIAEINVKCNIASPDEFPAKVNRPLYSVLDNHNLKVNNINKMSHWKVGLSKFLSS